MAYNGKHLAHHLTNFVPKEGQVLSGQGAIPSTSDPCFTTGWIDSFLCWLQEKIKQQA